MITAILQCFNSKPDSYGNRYWAFRWIDTPSAKRDRGADKRRRVQHYRHCARHGAALGILPLQPARNGDTRLPADGQGLAPCRLRTRRVGEIHPPNA